MNREEFLSACGECEVGYRAQLLDFYRNYADIVDKIYDKYALLDGEDQNKMLVERLKNWLEQGEYSDIVDKIYDKYALLDGEDQNKMLVERLKNWLEQGEYSDIVSTINTLDENSEQKVLGFIHLYEYILKTTNDDFELIDQLFFIPGRFEREFQRK